MPAPVGVRDAISAALALALMLPAPAAALPRLHAADGELRDEQGRSVMLRGVNLPWGLRVPEVAARPSVPADQDAAQMATLGFNVARLQLSWKAIEPGHAGPNDPSICAPGPPTDPGQWDQAHADAYLDRVEEVVDALQRRGIGTLFQIAQYGYNDRFGGPPSHPDWAVCTDGLPITAGRGATAYTQPGGSAAARHFWENDVRGDLQGEYHRMLRALARRFAGHQGVVGYELYNEPYDARALTPQAGFDGLVQCFYAGRADPGLLADGSRPSCPAGVPEQGAIQAIRSEDADGVVHAQAHIFTNFAVASRMGPLPAANLVFNFHVYCLSEVVTQPQRTREPGCTDAEERAVDAAGATRQAMASPREPGALPWFLSEFGYTSNEQTLRHMTALADRHHLGWTYFVWRADRGFDTSDNPGMLRRPDGTLRPAARMLARPYPAALAGTPQRMSYDVERRAFELLYTPVGDAPSEVVLPPYAYGADGACIDAAGARWRIRGDRLLLVRDPGADRVRLQIVPGRCGRSSTLPCTSRRRFGIRLHQPPRDPLVRARVLIAGKRAVVHRRGRRLVALVDLRGRPRERVVVRIRGRTRSGETVQDRRVYRTCGSARAR